MAFEVPHKHDISLDGQEMRNQMIENFEAIEQEDSKDDLAFEEFQKDTNARLNQLEQEKTTRDELKNVQEAWKKKIEHVALGTDYETVEQAVMQILKEKGMI
ncbi:MAG TPA: hypothetical protein H9958_04725 [Candidatus Limosilactobacillus intestinavium]|nr:hypothetical protein [Candidatus Limosilactobacillus intestinavium]